jgi:uncharacterized SAM-binding protein YcdF (DUF218 family)
MPRALAEMRAALPGVDLIPYPVSGPARPASVGEQAQALRLLWREYLKYIVAAARLELDRAGAGAKAAGERAEPPAKTFRSDAISD